jgi:acyl-CoA synthetase (AMP-forming)/AMP-acid ligase II
VGNLPKFSSYAEALDWYADGSPETPATWFPGAQLTYGELRSRVDRLGRGLVGAGVKPGERVLSLCTPRPEFWVAALAIMRVGAVYVGVNPSYTKREQLHVASDSQASLLLALSSALGRSYVDEMAQLLEEVPSLEAAFRLDDGDQAGVLRPLGELLARGSAVNDDVYRARIGSVDPTTAAALVYTSGTSGTPKGAVLPQIGLASAALSTAGVLRIQTPRVLCNLPTNHVACLVDVCGSTLMKGGMIAFMEKFDPATMLELTESLRIAALTHVPTVLQLLATHPDFEARDLSSVSVVSWGGARMPVDVVRFYRAKGYRLVAVYGMTEVMGNVSFTRDDADDETLAHTVGKPNEDADVKLVDESDEEVGVEEEGEVLYRHPAMMLGYFNNETATRAAFTADGFYRTGDVGVMQADGNLRLVGRRSEMFKSGGLNVYPREVELALEALEGVALAAVVSIPDRKYSEVGHACIVLEPGCRIGEDQVRSWCRSQLAGYKVPKSFQFRDELPLLAIGKVDKKKLRQELLAADD